MEKIVENKLRGIPPFPREVRRDKEKK